MRRTFLVVEDHPNEQITLEIIMNSSNIDSMKKAENFGAVGFSKNKVGVVTVIKDLLKKQLETRTL